MPKTTRSVQYRYLHRPSIGDHKEVLSALLLRALQAKRNGDVIGQKVRARIADLEQSGQMTLINDLQGADGKGALAGELLLYRQGFNVPAIEELLESEDNRFKKVNFKTDGKSKPVEGALYFACIGDHVGLIASNAVTARWLERYLTWLLKDAAEILQGEEIVELSSAIQLKDAQPSSGGGGARAVTISAEPVSGGGKDRTVRSERARGKGATVLKVLEVLGVGKDAIASIERDIPEGGRLEGNFQVYVKQGNKRQELAGETIDHAFRNMDPSDLTFERRGSRVRNNLQHLSEPVRVETDAGAGLDANDAIERIIEQLYRWDHNGRISIDPTL